IARAISDGAPISWARESIVRRAHEFVATIPGARPEPADGAARGRTVVAAFARSVRAGFGAGRTVGIGGLLTRAQSMHPLSGACRSRDGLRPRYTSRTPPGRAAPRSEVSRPPPTHRGERQRGIRGPRRVTAPQSPLRTARERGAGMAKK